VDHLRDKVASVVRQVVLEMLQAEGDGLLRAAVDLPTGRRPLVVANWKMNQTLEQARDFAARFEPDPAWPVELVICPPLTALHTLRSLSGIGLGAQNAHAKAGGAYTGEVSPIQLRNAGCRYVILGHSERRRDFAEDEAVVRAKAEAARRAGLRPLICVGESAEERDRGRTFARLREQVTGLFGNLPVPAPDPDCLAVAYEPIWAIGTGRHARPAEAQEALSFIRDRLAELVSHPWASRVRLLYGGSVDPDNAAALARQADLDGFLVGGASLDPERLRTIASVFERPPAEELR
jgi:triosephosphate isomerase